MNDWIIDCVCGSMLSFLMYRLYCKEEPINVKYGIGKEGGIKGNRDGYSHIRYR